MPDECIDHLNIKPDGIYVDGTCGGGGHSARIAELLRTGRLISIDRDARAVTETKRVLEKFGEKIIVIKNNFYTILKFKACFQQTFC